MLACLKNQYLISNKRFVKIKKRFVLKVYLRTQGQSKFSGWKLSFFSFSGITTIWNNWNSCYLLHSSQKIRHCLESWRRFIIRWYRIFSDEHDKLIPRNPNKIYSPNSHIYTNSLSHYWLPFKVILIKVFHYTTIIKMVTWTYYSYFYLLFLCL